MPAMVRAESKPELGILSTALSGVARTRFFDSVCISRKLKSGTRVRYKTLAFRYGTKVSSLSGCQLLP